MVLLLSTRGAVKSRAARERKAREDQAMENASPVTAQHAPDGSVRAFTREKAIHFIACSIAWRHASANARFL